MKPAAALAFAVAAAMAWRAGATLLMEARRLAASDQPAWSQRLLASTDARIARALGVRARAPREHVAFAWLPWQEAAERCFSPSNAEAIRTLPLRLAR